MTENLLHNIPVLIIWLLTGSYAVFTFLLLILWNRSKAVNNHNIDKNLKISVIIPVRNEVHDIANLLNDLKQQTLNRNQFEVFVMDDASTDGTTLLVKQLIPTLPYNILLVELPDEPTTSPKKRAIETALKLATGNLIVTTDGDCRAGKHWLYAFAKHYLESGAKLISGPVSFMAEQTVTDHLQTVEFASLIGSGASAISAGYPSLCNGANLAYEKRAFVEVNGFEGTRHVASGDDEFLMHKIAHAFPGQVAFLKDPDAVVLTKAHKSWRMFFRQRKRWASKWKHYQSKTPLLLALYVFSCNLALIASILFFVFGQISATDLIILYALKCAPEWFFLGSVLRFLNKTKSIPFIPLTQIFYPFYVCFFGLAVQNPVYEWKGRKLT